MDKNTLKLTAYAWMVTLGDWMVPFRVFDIIQAFPAFKNRYIKEVLEKEEKTLEKKKNEEQE